MKALEIKNLSKTYASGTQALKDIDLSVEAGDFFALLGPNGAGKSTAIGVICSLVNKTQGEVKIFGDDLDTAPEAVKCHIGIVPQEFNFNIWEPVEEIVLNQAGYYGLSRKAAQPKLETLLKALDLWDKRKAQASELSGGMKRRLMIARALIHQPKLLILDEPTAGVDIELRRGMWDYLTELNRNGTTIILTTHYLEEAESLCRNIAIIDQGEVVEHTSMKSLLSSLNEESYVLDVQPLRTPPQLANYTCNLIDEHTLEVNTPKSEGLNDLFVQLKQAGVEVMSLRNKANRLEELFVRLTHKAGGK